MRTRSSHYLRAASFYEVGIHMLYGSPVDPRLSDVFDRLTEAFDRAMALARPTGGAAVDPLRWSRDARVLPPGRRRRGGRGSARRDLYERLRRHDGRHVPGQVIDACRRGYHCVIFDGPGQGSMLVRDGVAMVPDWERVVTPVVDAVIARDDVDTAKVVLQGWSLGGYLAARAATGEHRLAACVLDPPGLEPPRRDGAVRPAPGDVRGGRGRSSPEISGRRRGDADGGDRREPRPALEDRAAGVLGQRCR